MIVESVFRYLGKTSLLYKLSLGDFVTTKPTLGFNVETISYNNNTITLWDMGGTPSIRRLWKHYYLNCHGIYLTTISSVMVNLTSTSTVTVSLNTISTVTFSLTTILTVTVNFTIISDVTVSVGMI